MRRSRVPVAEKRPTEAKYNSSLRKTTSMGPKITKKNFSVNMVSTRSTAENRAREGMEGCNIRPEDTYRRITKLSLKTTG